MTKIKNMTLEQRKEYYRNKLKEWRIRNPEKNKEQRKKYKQSEKGKKAIQKYKINYKNNPLSYNKTKIRDETYRIYGKVPVGYERHHLNYDSPHNFILVPKIEHQNIHKLIKYESKQGGNNK
jgi:hypothetical protein